MLGERLLPKSLRDLSIVPQLNRNRLKLLKLDNTEVLLPNGKMHCLAPTTWYSPGGLYRRVLKTWPEYFLR